MLLLALVIFYALFLSNLLLKLCSLFYFTLHLQDGLAQPWRTVTEDCTTSDSFSILDAFFEGPSVFTILGNPISVIHNIRMSNYGLQHRAGRAGTKIQVGFSYRRSSKFVIIGRCIFGQIADCRLPTSCNVNQNCVFFSFLFAHSPNQPRQAEDILVHGVPSTRGEGYFAMIL